LKTSNFQALHLHSTIPITDLHSVPASYTYGDRVDWGALYDTIVDVGYRRTFNLEVRTSPKLNREARSAYYRFAYAVAAGIIDKTIK